MKLGIIANVKKTESRSIIEKMQKYCIEKGIILFLQNEYKDLAMDKDRILPITDIIEKADIIVSVGGDGTFLKASHFIKDSGKAILGINAGHLGFLAETRGEDAIKILDDVVAGRYKIEKRMVLKGEFAGESYHCLNDVVIHMGSTLRIVDLQLKLNGVPVAHFRADGIIFSTPTGSTAYSLAAGGPILIPTVDAIVITPIAPHNLGHRPFIVPYQTDIEVELLSSQAIISFDGQLQRNLEMGDRIRIKKAGFSIKIIKGTKSNYFNLLREKLDWGG